MVTSRMWPQRKRVKPGPSEARPLLRHLSQSGCEVSIGCSSGRGGRLEFSTLQPDQENNRRNSHKNAGATFEGRKLLIDDIAVMGLTPVAEDLLDRSSRPLKVRNGLDETLCQRMEQVRRSRMHMRRRADIVGRSMATVKKQAPFGLGLQASSFPPWREQSTATRHPAVEAVCAYQELLAPDRGGRRPQGCDGLGQARKG